MMIVGVLGLFWGNVSKLTAYFNDRPKKPGSGGWGGTPPDPRLAFLRNHFSMLEWDRKR